MKILLILITFLFLTDISYSQLKYIKKDNEKLLFDGYYSKKDSVKFDFTDLSNAVSSTVTKNLVLNNNPSCIDLEFLRKGQLFLSFSSYTSTYLMGVTSEEYSATVVAYVELVTNSSTNLIVDSHTFSISNMTPNTTEFNKHALNKHILKIDIPDLKSFNSATISQINIKLTNSGSYTNASANFISKLNEEINFEAFYTEELTYDIHQETTPLISVDYQQNSNSFSYKYIDDTEDNNFRKVRLKWNNLTCDEYEFDNFQVQLLKIVNLEDKTNASDEFDEFTSTFTKVDWNKATTFEVGNSNTFIDLYITQGKGYYTWRVRPISYYHVGEMTELKNYGIWNGESMEQGDPFDINSSSSNTFYYFYYDNQNYGTEFDLTDNLNWQHVRVFNEGDFEGSQHYDEIIYSDNLLGKRQYQKKLNNNDYQILSEFIPDHSGRAILTSIPVPTSAIADWQDNYSSVSHTVSHGTDLLYKNNVFGETSKSFNIANFDLSDPNPTNDVVKNPNSIPTTEGGLTNGLIMDYYNNSGVTPNNVPKTQGYPYSRVIFYNDGTERVKEEIIPDSYKYFGTDKNIGSVKYFYTNATQKELNSLFGKEAPDSTKVFKQITKDENKVYHINYKDNKGNVIASGILKDSHDNLLDIQNSTANNELNIDGDVGIYPLNREYEIKKSSNGINYSFENKGKFYLQNPTTSTFTYSIDDETFALEVCDYVSNSSTTYTTPTQVFNFENIPYAINLNVINTDEFYAQATEKYYSSTTSNNLNYITPASGTIVEFTEDEPTNYHVNRRIEFDINQINTLFANYKSDILTELIDVQFDDVFELIAEFNDPSSTMTMESFIEDIDNIANFYPWDVTQTGNIIKLSFDNNTHDFCQPVESNSFEFEFKICPNPNNPCGINPDYEQVLIDAYVDREYLDIDGSTTTTRVFGQFIDDYFYRKYNNKEATPLFLKNSGTTYVENGWEISDESYTYYTENSLTYSTNNGAINKLIENMLSETFTSTDYQIRNKDLFDSDESGDDINYLGYNLQDTIYQKEDICECWNKSVANFGIYGLEINENGKFVLNKDFDLLNDFLNCTGRMLRGFTNSAFSDEEKGIDMSGIGQQYTNVIPKSTFTRQDTVFGGGYITNAHKYIYSDFVNSSTFDGYNSSYSDLNWYGQPSANSHSFVRGFTEVDLGVSGTFYNFTLVSNAGTFTYDDPKNMYDYYDYSPSNSEDANVTEEEIRDFEFDFQYALIAGEIKAYGSRDKNFNDQLQYYLHPKVDIFRDILGADYSGNSNTFNMQWEKLYNDWIGEDYVTIRSPQPIAMLEDKDGDNISKKDAIKKSIQKNDASRPDDVDFSIEENLDEEQTALIDKFENDKETHPTMLMLEEATSKCIQACDIRDIGASLRDAYYNAQDNYIIEGDLFWTSPQGELFNVEWSGFPNGHVKDAENVTYTFIEKEILLVSLEEFNQHVYFIRSSCRNDCSPKDCATEDDLSIPPGDNQFESTKFTDIDIEKTDLKKKDNEVNSAKEAINSACFAEEFDRIIAQTYYTLDIQIPTKDCYGNKNVCEYVPEYDEDRYLPWQTTKIKRKLIYEGKYLNFPQSEEEYEYLLKKELAIIKRKIAFISFNYLVFNIKLWSEYKNSNEWSNLSNNDKSLYSNFFDLNLYSLLSTYDVKNQVNYEILQLKNFDPRFDIIDFNDYKHTTEDFRSNNGYNNINFDYQMVNNNQSFINNTSFSNAINPLIMNHTERYFSFSNQYTNYYYSSSNNSSNPSNAIPGSHNYFSNNNLDISNLIDFDFVYNNNLNAYTYNRSKFRYTFYSGLNGKIQRNNLTSQWTKKAFKNMEYQVSDDFIIENGYIIHKRISTNRNILNKFTIDTKNNTFYSNLKEAVQKSRLTNKFGNKKFTGGVSQLSDYLSGIYAFTGDNANDLSSYTIKPNWSFVKENDGKYKNSYTLIGKGKFLEIPPYPEPEEFYGEDKFVCYRYYNPIENDNIDIQTEVIDCEEGQLYTFETQLLDYIHDWAENIITDTKIRFNQRANTFVNNLDEFHVQQEDLNYQKMTLMYYDNSNNLVQTTPPKGVVIDEAVNDEEEDVEESLETIYQYNSLGQIKTSKTPDQNSFAQVEVGKLGSTTFYDYEGETIYIYDLAGRLRITVNPIQFKNKTHGDKFQDGPPVSTYCYSPKASYYKYDKKGRLIETGEFTGVYIEGLTAGQEYSQSIFTLGQYLEKYLKTKNNSGKTSNQIQLEKADFAKYNKMFEKYLFDNLDFPTDIPTITSNDFPMISNYPNYHNGFFGTHPLARYIGLKTITIYDEPSILSGIPTQKNLRNRISEITRIPDSYHNKTSEHIDYVTSVYSYDLHGNVDWYYQYMLLKRYSNINLTGYTKGKLVKYEYDLLSGKVKELVFQDGKVDEFTQKFEYDADNRLTTVASTRYDINVEKDVEYFYAKHGPLERKVLGNDQVQGMDYYYTIHGWLKGINSLNNNGDFLGGDAGTGINKLIPYDVFSMGLRYYEDDFKNIAGNDNFFANSYQAYPNSYPTEPQYNGNIAEWEVKYNPKYLGDSPNFIIDERFKNFRNKYNYDLSGRLISTTTGYSNATYPVFYSNINGAFSASFNYDLNGNMYDIERNDETGASTNYDISLNGNTNQLYQTSHSGNTYSYDYDEMGQLIREIHVGGSSTFEDVADSIFWTADGKIDFIADGTHMTYPGVAYTPDVIFPRKHYYYDGMGNRVAIVTEETSSVNGSEIFEQYCYEEGNPYVGCEECRMNVDYTIDTYFYEAGGKLLYKNKLINDWGIDIQCIPNTNDVEWYVYGSASDGRIATVYPRFKIQDNDFYDINFEDDPPNNQVAYNTEMISNTFTANAGIAGITGIETHRHLGEKRYEIKDHLGNVRATVSDIKNAENYSASASSWKFLADIKSMSNYFPYGMKIDAGSCSPSKYHFAYNGKQEESFDKDFLHYGARSHYTNYSQFISPDPLENMFPEQSTYVYAGNNPIKFIDYNGTKKLIHYYWDVTCDIKGIPTIVPNDKKSHSFSESYKLKGPNFSTAFGGRLIEDDGKGLSTYMDVNIYTYKGKDYTNKYDIPDGIGDFFRKKDEEMNEFTNAVFMAPFELMLMTVGVGEVSLAIRAGRYATALIQTYLLVDQAYNTGSEIYNYSTGNDIPNSSVELGFSYIGYREFGKTANNIIGLTSGSVNIYKGIKNYPGAKNINLPRVLKGGYSAGTSGYNLFQQSYNAYDSFLPVPPITIYIDGTGGTEPEIRDNTEVKIDYEN